MRVQRLIRNALVVLLPLSPMYIYAANPCPPPKLVIDSEQSAPSSCGASAVNAPVVNSRALFVATNGSDNNNGRSQNSALRTIAHAASLAKPGETIYVKAGRYSNENIEIAREGNSDNPITIEGYRKKPGDRPTHSNISSSSALDSAIMPLLDGQARGSDKNTAIRMSEHHVIRNLQLKNYSHGIDAHRCKSSKVIQTYVADLGVNSDDNYSGYGIVIGANASKCIVEDSTVINAGAESLMVYGDNNRVTRARVIGNYENGNKNSPDYYLFLFGNSNIVEHSFVHRAKDLYHDGHGIGIKKTGENNIIRNNEISGVRGGCLVARHRAVKNNLFQNNKCTDVGAAMVFRDGASNNIVEGLTAERAYRGITFFDTTEDQGKQFSGANNIVRNSLFISSEYAISLHDYMFSDSYARGNEINNIEIQGATYLFEVSSRGANNSLKNSKVRDVTRFSRHQNGLSDSSMGFSLSNNDMSSNGFAAR